MKRTFGVLACALMLTGCATARLGTVLYCPWGATCVLQTMTPQPDPPAPPVQPAPAEKPASASA